MPGDFIDEVHIFQCGTRPDGSAIMCSEVLFNVKVPFPVAEDAAQESGWREAGADDVHFPFAALIRTMREHGVPVSFDEAEWERRRRAGA